MCIAIVNKYSVLPLETFKNSFENNPDGAGIAYVGNKGIEVIKEMADYKKLYDKYVEIRQETDMPILIHFRIGTSGIKDERNVHPFLVSNSLALIHNGMIDYNIVNKDYSDTWHFTELIKSLKNADRVLNSDSIEFQMLSAFTRGSKVAFLHDSGQFSIINESAGHWAGDTWYSNKTYMECDYFNVGGKKVYKYDGLFDESENEFSVFNKHDLDDWHLNVLSEYELEAYMPYDEATFNTLDYSNKTMYLLSLHTVLYNNIDTSKTATMAIEDVRAHIGKRSYKDMFNLLCDEFYSYLIASYDTSKTVDDYDRFI